MKVQDKSRRMISIDLMGGIGNQLFRYVAALALADKFKADVSFYFDELPHNHTQFNSRISDLGLDLPITDRKTTTRMDSLKRIADRVSHNSQLFDSFRKKILRIHEESSCTFGQEVQAIERKFGRFPFPSRIHLVGHFQNIEYFTYLQEVGNPLLERLLQCSASKSLNLSLGMSQTGDECLVHVRRGDFKSHKSDIGMLDQEYYRRAFVSFSLLYPESRFIVISDDINEARDFLPKEFLGRCTFIQEPESMTPASLIQELVNFENFIISNSTFSLWIALLAKKSSNVMFPHPFNFNLKFPVRSFPSSWNQIESSFERD